MKRKPSLSSLCSNRESDVIKYNLSMVYSNDVKLKDSADYLLGVVLLKR